MSGDSTPVVFYVATNGNDAWSGQLASRNASGSDGPFASLERARDAVRCLKQDGPLPAGGVSILIRGGDYVLDGVFVLSPEDSGDAEAPICYRAYDGERVRLLGGSILAGFEPYEGRILKLELSKCGLRGCSFNQLFFDGVRQPLARYPNIDPIDPIGGGWLYVEGEPPDMYEHGHGLRDRFICHDPRLAAWSHIGEVELFIYPRYNWCNNIIRLKSYDSHSGEVVLQQPTSYEIYPGDRFYFRNVREELDAPGEWYLDNASDILYFWPPATQTIVRIEGDSCAEHGYITLRGITLEACTGNGIVIKDACYCAVQACTIRNTGLIGIDIVGGCHNSVEGCDVSHTGSTGIHCLGGVRNTYDGTYTMCHHRIHNNYIHHVGDIVKSVPGILVGSEGGPGAVGVTVSHNLIHDGPRWGIFSRGNDNTIEYNHIRHVNTETSDTSAIDMCDRDWSMRGTIIRYNHIHDVLGYHREGSKYISPTFAFGIYLDDWTSGVHVYGNLTYRTPWGGMYINSGQDNIVENNCFLNAADHLAYYHRWRDDAQEVRHVGTHGLGMRRNIFRRNIVAGDGEATVVYAFGACQNADGNLDIAGNCWEHNLVWRGGRPLKVRSDGRTQPISWEEWLAMGYDNDSIVADPLFVDVQQDDYHLRPESPALHIGFELLPIEQMGPFADGSRASWPIVEAEGIREHPLKHR